MYLIKLFSENVFFIVKCALLIVILYTYAQHIQKISNFMCCNSIVSSAHSVYGTCESVRLELVHLSLHQIIPKFYECNFLHMGMLKILHILVYIPWILHSLFRFIHSIDRYKLSILKNKNLQIYRIWHTHTYTHT